MRLSPVAGDEDHAQPRPPDRDGRAIAGPGHAGRQRRRRLPVSPWSARWAASLDGRPALEIYEHGDLLDVMVETALARHVLRGARRSGRGAAQRSIAWGRLPAGGGDVTVTFVRGRLRRRACPAELACLTSWCWVAVAEGRFRTVSVDFLGARHRLRLRSR